MLNVVKLEGKNKEDLLKKYFEENNCSESDIFLKEEEVQGKLFQGKKVVLTILNKNDIKAFIKDYINNLSYFMNITINCEIREADDIFSVLLVSSNNPIIIGKDGRTLNSIQMLLRQAISANTGFNVKVNMDASGYKAKKQKNLEFEIKKIAKEVMSSKIEAKLDPMNSYERRIIHNLIGNYEELETESFGEAPNRYVVIRCKEDK